MSQFNQPRGPAGQPVLGGKPTPVPYENYQPPPPRSSGANVVLIVLGIVFGLMLVVVLACGILGFMFTRAVTTMTGEFQTFFLQEMANQVVESYAEHAAVVEHIGEVQDYSFQESGGFEALNKPILRLRVEGDKGTGTIVLYRRGSRQQKVTLEVDGQEFLLDDNPRDFFEQEFDIDEKWTKDGSAFEVIRSREGGANQVPDKG